MGYSKFKSYRLYNIESIFAFKVSVTEKAGTTSNVFQNLNHINIFDVEYHEMPIDDERVDLSLNSDQRSPSDSRHSFVPSGDVNTINFPNDNSRNDAQSRNDSTGYANLLENIFFGNYNDFVVDSKLNKNYELKTFFDASKYSYWTDARNDEMDALLRNDTWEIVDLPKDKKTIGSKWIFKIKYKCSGEIDRYKAQLVDQGFNQKKGIDYEETLSPIVIMVNVRCLLNLVMSNSWPVFQLDVNSAFLYGDLNETVYMKLLEGYYPTGDNKVCRLKSQSKFDYSLFTKFDKGVFLALLVYVDDIIITGNSVSEIDKFKVFLKSKFMIKDLGKPKYFLGIEVIDTDKGAPGLGVHIVKDSELNGRNATIRLHYGSVLVRGLATEYKDFDYVNTESEENRVCKLSFTLDLMGLGFKDEDVNGLYYRESTKTLTNG
ncbi:ribonuclease H-like domain-containing protein [Tanacetum coccineum]